MKNKEQMDIKEKVKWVASTMEIENGDTEFSYFEDMMNGIFENDPDLPLIKQKMDNLVALCYEKNKNSEEFENFLDLDFETEIWEMI